jgi:hypothetical protein
MAPLWRTRPCDRPSVSPCDPQCHVAPDGRGNRLLPMVANVRRTGDLACRVTGFPTRALQQVDEAALGARVTVDIGLRVLYRTVPGQLLNIAKAAACLEHEPGGIGDEGAAPRV